MSTDVHDSTPGTAADTSPPPGPRAPAMASLAQWEERGSGLSGTTIVSAIFSVGAMALVGLLVKTGVLAPDTLTVTNDTLVRRTWAPFFDVSAVGTASVNAAQPATSLSTPAPPAAEPVATPTPTPTPTARDTAPASLPARTRSAEPRAVPPTASKATDDPYAHLEEGARTTPSTPTAPPIEAVPRINAGRNTVAVPGAPSDAEGVPPSNHGRSTWGGQRTPSP